MLRYSQRFPLQPLPSRGHMESPELMLFIYPVGFQSMGCWTGYRGITPRVRGQGYPGKGPRRAQAGQLAGVRSGAENGQHKVPPRSSLSCRWLSSSLPLLPLSTASLPAPLAVEIPSSCLGLPQAWGISLPLKPCNPQQQVQWVERRWQSPGAASDPSPGPAILILVGTPCHPPIPPSYLCTAAAHKWASRDGNLRQLFGVEKHVKTCLDGLPARQTPASPRLIRALAHHPINGSGRGGLCLASGSPQLDGC